MIGLLYSAEETALLYWTLDRLVLVQVLVGVKVHLIKTLYSPSVSLYPGG